MTFENSQGVYPTIESSALKTGTKNLLPLLSQLTRILFVLLVFVLIRTLPGTCIYQPCIYYCLKLAKLDSLLKMICIALHIIGLVEISYV